MDTLVVVQARMGSTRLPGKVLEPVAGQPMLAFQLARLQAGWDGPIVVATSTEDRDDPVVTTAEAAGVAVVRGSEADVLDRYLSALAAHDAAHVVRLTADCPLTDPGLVAGVVAHHEATGADYTSNVHPRSYPKGLDVEVLAADALRAAGAEADDPVEREHVTPFVIRRPERFALATVWSGDAALGREWWTVDRPEDLDEIRGLVAALDDPVRADWRQILSTVGRHRAPGAGERWLRPDGPPPAGSAPWATTWSAVRDGRVEARVRIEVADGRATVHADRPLTSEVEAVVDDHLATSVQIAHPTPV